MSTWLVILVAALGLMVWGRRLKIIDEIYSLAIYTMSILTLIFGLTLAPDIVSLILGLVTLGWLQFKLSKS